MDAALLGLGNPSDVFDEDDIDDWTSRVAHVESILRNINATRTANPQAELNPEQYGCIEYHLEIISNLQNDLESQLRRYNPDASGSEDDDRLCQHAL